MADERHLLVYGGTFDPVHWGHLRTSAAAAGLVGAGRVVMVPAWRSPHKAGREPGGTGEERVEMCRLSVAGNDLYEVDGREVLRGESGGGMSYTIETVEEILAERGKVKLTLLVGADQVAGLGTWRRVGELLSMVEVAVMRRGEGAVDVGAFGGKVRVVETPVVGISSTEIRRRVRCGEGIGGMVPEAVERFIWERGLYRI